MLAKVLEKAVYFHYKAHVDYSSIVPGTQSGFRAIYGTATALLSMVDNFFKSVDVVKCI